MSTKVVSLDDYRKKAGTFQAESITDELRISIEFPRATKNKKFLIALFDGCVEYIRDAMEAEIEERR